MMRLILLLAVLILLPAHARAIEQQQEGDSSTRTIADYIKDYVDIPRGGTDWKVFGQTKEIPVEGKTPDGLDYGYTKPEFSDAVKALDGKDVILKGFMFPLDPEEKQHLFLFGPFPVSCPFHYHVGPSLVVEAHTPEKTPVEFSYDPLVLKGRLELVPKDEDNSVFYRLVDAQIVK